MTARIRPGRVILGSFDGIETAVRQLRRTRPLEVTELQRVPTADEMLRVNAGSGWPRAVECSARWTSTTPTSTRRGAG